MANGDRPLLGIGLLRTDMEGDTDWAQAQRLGMH